MVGWPVIVMVLLVSALCAAVAAVFLMVSRGRKRTDVIPFGPFLAVATVLALFWGQTGSDWVFSAIPGLNI
jgi:leader peptidase (prepilin peptidase)/N-methyltransferase